MGLFKKKNKQEVTADAPAKNDDGLKESISKAYDELVSGDVQEEAAAEETAVQTEIKGVNLEMELIKSKIVLFKERKTEQTLLELLKLLPGKEFFILSVSNVKQPYENVNGQTRLKKGIEINPALLTGPDKKLFFPIFTDKKAITQKSPSNVILKFTFEQCMNIIMDSKNPINAMVINPFSENMILSNELLKNAFKKVEKH